MIRVLLVTTLGILTSGSGFYTAYLYIKNLDGVSQPWFLILAPPLIILEVFLLLRANRAEEVVGKEDLSTSPPENPSPQSAGKPENLLDRNNKLAAEMLKNE